MRIDLLLSLLAAWALLYALFWGLGHLVVRCLRVSPAEGDALPEAFWLGWGAAIVFLQIWHLFHPVDGCALAVLAPLGLVGCFSARSSLRAALASDGRLLLTAFFALAALLAAFALGVAPVYDSGLYHVPSVMWSRTYAIVPGLGNLHGRLAFGSTSFLFAALLDAGPLEGRAHMMASGLLVFASLGGLLPAFQTFRRRHGAVPFSHHLGVLFLPACLSQLLLASSPTPDVPVFLLGLVLTLQYFSLASERGRSRRLLSILFLSAVGVSIKLTFAIFGGALSLLALGLYGRGRRLAPRVLALTALVLVPWVARNVVLSGYLAYPIASLRVPISWRVPTPSVVEMSLWIRSWARYPHQHWRDVPGRAPWIAAWLLRNASAVLVLSAAALLVFLALSLTRWARTGRFPVRRAMDLYLAALGVSILFWFFSAPDPRFAGALFWLLLAVLTSWIVQSRTRRRATASRVFLALSLAFSATILAADSILTHRRRHWDERALFGPSARAFVTDSGLTVYVPATGDQCWALPLPCTPYPNPGLRLRVPGSLQGGFVAPDPNGRCGSPP